MRFFQALSGSVFSVALILAAGTVLAQTPAPSPSPSPQEPSPPEATPPPAPPPSSGKIFNPDIAVIGNFVGAAGDNEVDPRPTLQLEEAELALQAIVDPYARADFFLAFGPEGAEIEEGYITFTSLPAGFLMKVGKLKANVGKSNTFHAHNLPWVERPLVNVNLLGGEEGLADSGISVSRLFPNPLLFLEATGEVFAGENEVFQAPRRRDLTYVGRLRAYRDLGESSNLELGGSFAGGGTAAGAGLHNRIVGVDLTFRWRPLRRAIYRRFLARTELLWSRREGPEGRADAFGAYVAGEYQLARRWFVGARYDRSERADDPSAVDKGGSLLLTFWPSEFSQVRGQLRRIEYAEGLTANEVLFQFLFSIGAHGAHPF
jgi:hypothetical protein